MCLGSKEQLQGIPSNGRKKEHRGSCKKEMAGYTPPNYETYTTKRYSGLSREAFMIIKLLTLT